MDAPVLHVLVDRTPPTLRQRLAEACAQVGVGYHEVHVRSVPAAAGPLPRGALLFNPSGSRAAERVERQLFQPGVATFHADDLLGPLQVVVDPLRAFVVCGLPVPPTVEAVRGDDEEVDGIVATLGPPPYVVKVPGGEDGAGVLRCDDERALRDLVRALVLAGGAPWVQAWVEGATHWRLIVVGDRVVSAYRNVRREGDFRTGPSPDPADFGLVPPPALVDVALRAAVVAGTRFAGVDLLVRDDTVALLEANSPCWFPAAEVHPGTPDVAVAMVTWLRDHARRLLG